MDYSFQLIVVYVDQVALLVYQAIFGEWLAEPLNMLARLILTLMP